MARTRSANLDKCFDNDERRWLYDGMDVLVAMEHMTLGEMESKQGAIEIGSVEDYANIVGEQKRKLQFYQLLLECLEGGEHDNDS